MAGTRNYQSIGEVLVAVKTEFPDITISKIRFLESEGLITPERTPSGYRKFYVDDVDRLKSILRMQRDEYLPLKVIKERLVQSDELDGQAVDNGPIDPSPEPDESCGGADRSADVDRGDERRHGDRSRANRELESFGLIKSGPDGAKYFDDDYIAVDRQGLPVRCRAPTPDDVQALRGAGGRLLRVDRDAPTPPAEPRRAPGRDRLADRARARVAQAEAGAAAHQPPPAPDVTRRPARALSLGALISVLLSLGAARAQIPDADPAAAPADAGRPTERDQLVAVPSTLRTLRPRPRRGVDAAAAVLADLDTGQVLFALNCNERRPIAASRRSRPRSWWSAREPHRRRHESAQRPADGLGHLGRWSRERIRVDELLARSCSNRPRWRSLNTSGLGGCSSTR
jgi:DNA-binding transcriptional MerR regulator